MAPPMPRFELGEGSKIRLQVFDLGGAVEDYECIANRAKDLALIEAQRGQEFRPSVAGDGRAGWKVHFEEVIQAVYGQDPAAGVKANRPMGVPAQSKDVGRGQGRMAAQVVFHSSGSEPAQIEVGIRTGDDEGGLAVTILCRNFLEGAVGGKCRKEADSGGVAAKDFFGEGVDMVVRNCHSGQSTRGECAFRGRARRGGFCTQRLR